MGHSTSRARKRRGFHPLTWLGGHEMAVLLALAGVVAGVWGLRCLRTRSRRAGTQAFDQKLLLAFRTGPSSCFSGPATDTGGLQRDITSLGGVVVLTLVTVIAAGFLALDGKKHMALFLCGSGAGRVWLSEPSSRTCFIVRCPIWFRIRFMFPGASFPSGHSMMSAVTYLTLGALLARSQERNRLKAYAFSWWRYCLRWRSA